MFVHIANHIFEIIGARSENLAPYLIFEHKEKIQHEPIFCIYIKESTSASAPFGELLGDFPDDNGTTKVYRTKQGFRFDYLSPQIKHYATVECSSDYSKAALSINELTHSSQAIDNAIMMLFAFTTAPLNTLLVHSSVVSLNKKGYLFLGKSGTGKSTHTRLWLKYIEGSELLNDDNPVIRIIESKAYVYGSPWSGKTHCYKNEGFPIGGIVHLRQSSENTLRRIKGAHALATILPSFSTLPCHAEIQQNTVNTAIQIAEIVPIYTLNCRPDAEAALICRDTITAV